MQQNFLLFFNTRFLIFLYSKTNKMQQGKHTIFYGKITGKKA